MISKGILFFFIPLPWLGCQNDIATVKEGDTTSVQTVPESFSKWQTGKAGEFAYLYPPDWIEKEEVHGTTKKIGLTRKDMQDLIPFYPVEIFEFEKQGHSFQEFASGSIEFVNKYQGQTVDIFNNKDSKIGGHVAKQISGAIQIRDTIVPITFYPIDGTKKFYLLLSNADGQMQLQVDKIVSTITFQ